MSLQNGTVLGGVLLIAGTSIGAGMLALPVLTGEAGFLPATLLFVVCWLVMVAAGWLLLQLFLRYPHCNNLLTLTETILGKRMRQIVWLVYAFLFYALLISYITGIGQTVQALTNHQLTLFDGVLLCVPPLIGIVYLGTRVVDRMNALLMVGLVATYLMFVFLGSSHIDFSHLQNAQWTACYKGIPIVLTAFGFHVIIPTLIVYLNRDLKKLRQVILLGSAVPLLVYIIWEGLILGIIPWSGAQGLQGALLRQENALVSLQAQTATQTVKMIGAYFSCFAIATSFLGVGLSFIDFLFDGLKLLPTVKNRWGILTLVFVPPLLISLWNPTLFFAALQIGGAPSCIFLYLVLPLWMLRQEKNQQQNRIVQQETIN